MSQTGLSDFGENTSQQPDRVVAEAQAVAGRADNAAMDVIDAEDVRFPDAETYVELMVTQVDYTIEGQGSEEYPVIHVFGRTANNEAKHVRVLGFRPYFYAPTDSLDDQKLDRDTITGTEEGYESIRGEALTKIFGRTPRDVGEMRDEFDHYEADILFPNRFLIDKDINEGVRLPARYLDDSEGADGGQTIQVPHDEVEPTPIEADLRVNFFDIEVDDRSGFPEEGEEPIICLTSHDSYRDEYVAWLYEAPEGDAAAPAELDGYGAIREETDIRVRSFDTEGAMLAAFLDYLDETDPDVASGWNFEDFDAPYLLDRLERLDSRSEHDLDPNRLSRIDEVWRSGWGGPNVKGRVVFDLLYAYKRTQFTELESYRLDAVAELELDVGKERYTGDLGDLWEQDPEQLLKYNLRDVELCVEIDRKQEVIPFWNEVRTFVGCKLEDAPTPGDAVDVYVLHKVHGEFALPSKGKTEGEEYEGGAVFDPITGLKENVTVLDLKSLYPMCMVTTNASPETKVDPDTYDQETYRAPNGIHFRKEPDGIIREMVDELLEEREQKKAKRNEYDPDSQAYEQLDRQQAAVKVIMNCFTPDTEVLTPGGVRNIRELDVGDEVYSLDPDSMEMEVKPVTETHAYPDYNGELVDIQTSKIDFRVTPNHRMLVRKNDTNGLTEGGWEFHEAGDLYDYCHYEMPHDWTFDHADSLDDTLDLYELADEYVDADITISDGGMKLAAQYGIPNISREVSTDDFLELLAWYITEGNVYHYNGNYRVKIAQEDGEIQNRIEELVDGLVDCSYSTDREISFSSRIWGELLQSMCGHGSENKRIPDLVFSASEEQKQAFLDTLIAGDGDRQPNSWRYSTVSTQLRDDVLRLCTHLGLTAQYSKGDGIWRIYVTQDGKNSFRMYRDGEITTASEGVYCVTVKDNNTLLAGRNGKYQNVGNSLYGVLGWDRFRLYDQEMGAAVTATGREVIEYTEQAANEIGYEVAYGDSVTGDRPVVVRDPDGKVRIRPIETLFERADSVDDATVVRTVDGGTVGSVSGVKHRRDLGGWEALSLSENGQPEWQPIEQVIRHEVDEPVVRLQHKFGESTTTTDHSYVVPEKMDGVAGESPSLAEVPPGEVDEPLRVPGLPEVESIETIDVYDVLEGYTRTYEDGRGGKPGETVTKTKAVHANDQYVWFGQEHHGELDTTVKIQRYVDLDSEDGDALIRLLAAYVSEGSATTAETSTAKFGASIAESRREWLEQLQEDYHRLFANTTASIIGSDARQQRELAYESGDAEETIVYEDETKKIQMMNELAAVFFREFAGQRSRGKHVPSFVFHTPADRQQLFLDVLIEGDGSRKFPRYSDSYAERNFDFTTTSRELAAGVSTLLIQRDEKHSFKYRDSKDSYTIRTCDSYRQGDDPVLTEIETDDRFVYDLSVGTNDNFVDAVGGIVLHNTDSVMLELGQEYSKDEAIEASFEIEEHINDSYDEFARERLNAETHRFQIEFEKLYRRFFQAGKKKRYAGHIVWKEGKDVDDIDITGFEYKRSDIAPITKDVQKRVLEMIVTGEDTEDIKDYLNQVISDFQKGNLPLDEIGIPGGIGKRLSNYDTDTAQVRGAKYANLLLGTNFQRGSKPKRLYLKKVHPEFFRRIEEEEGLDPQTDPLYAEFKRNPDVICFEYADQIPEAFEIDWDTMLEKTLKGPIERVIEALDISWEEVKTGQEQTGLGSFT